MAAKSISQFRAEYGIRLTELSENTGISEQRLKNIDNVMPAPYDEEQIIIEKYDLPEDYFTGDVIIKRVRDFNAFLFVSVIWYFIFIVATDLPRSIITSVTVNFFNTYIELASVIALIYNAAAVIICYMLFAKYLGKKYGFSADKNKYMFLYYLVPNGMLSAIAMIPEIANTVLKSENSDTAMVASVINSVYSFMIGVGAVFLLAKMLKCISDGDEKGNKTLKIFYIVYGINEAVVMIFTLISAIVQREFNLIYILSNVTYFAVTLAISIGLITKKYEEGETAERVFCYILPIASILISPTMSVLDFFI